MGLGEEPLDLGVEGLGPEEEDVADLGHVLELLVGDHGVLPELGEGVEHVPPLHVLPAQLDGLPQRLVPPRHLLAVVGLELELVLQRLDPAPMHQCPRT